MLKYVEIEVNLPLFGLNLNKNVVNVIIKTKFFFLQKNIITIKY